MEKVSILKETSNNSKYNIITVIPYVDGIQCTATLGTVYKHKQTNDNYGIKREININHNRHALQQEIKELENVDLVLLMDSDVIASEESLKALVDNFNGTPLALRTKPKDTGRHICCACCLIKFEDYIKIDYINEFVDVCQCQKIMNLFGASYLDGYSATEYDDPNKTEIRSSHVRSDPYTTINGVTRYAFRKQSITSGE